MFLDVCEDNIQDIALRIYSKRIPRSDRHHIFLAIQPAGGSYNIPLTKMPEIVNFVYHYRLGFSLNSKPFDPTVLEAE
jgi:hypothetical protein